jgi:hypothetical protein
MACISDGAAQFHWEVILSLAAARDANQSKQALKTMNLRMEAPYRVDCSTRLRERQPVSGPKIPSIIDSTEL